MIYLDTSFLTPLFREEARSSKVAAFLARQSVGTLAQQYAANFSAKLRAPDALHLAVAHNNDAEFVATLDEGMLFAAKKLKVAARRGIR